VVERKTQVWLWEYIYVMLVKDNGGYNKMPKIIIKGRKEYINYLSNHLRKEHPSTRRRMQVRR
jgi:hypothetical protein